jgi:hypothetical protein
MVPCRRRLELQHRHADIAAHLHVAAGVPQKMRDQRRGGRLAVGTGDGDERRIGCVRAPLAAEQFDIADDRDAGLRRELCGPMRLRMRQRHPGGEDQRRDTGPVDIMQVRGADFGLGRLRHLVRVVVEGDDIRAARDQRVTGGKPRAAEAEYGDCLPGEARDRDHRSFSVDSPISASMIEMIQNRITICGSVQPFCS